MNSSNQWVTQFDNRIVSFRRTTGMLTIEERRTVAELVDAFTIEDEIDGESWKHSKTLSTL